MTQQRQVPFSLVGCLLGFIFNKKHQPKFLRLATLEGEWQIKLAKPLRWQDYSHWIPGTQVQVWGYQKLKTDHLQLKAERLSLAALLPDSPLPPITADRPIERSVKRLEDDRAINQPTVAQIARPKSAVATRPAVIKVCQKSDCAKKGKAVCHAIDRMITQFGLEGSVTVEGTGCMKNCKGAPNLVVMPDKQRYSKIKEHEVATVFEKHFGHIAASVDLPA